MMHSNDESRILDKQTLEGRTTYILQDGVYLGDVFDFLPCGIINKSETGMGATTLELKSDRNSIIVEPTKITASSKAHKHNALYVGTPTKYHPQRIKGVNIKAYIEDESIEHKKIVVVADSLWKVIGAIGESVYHDYHLFLDEIDSFQMDSTFRDSMETCLDYYKKFDPEKRLMVSATLVEFSDPELKGEPYTTFQYQNPTVRTISLLHFTDSSVRGNFLGCISDQIKALVENFPDQKIMIAFNSVSQCFSLAVDLIGSGIAQLDEVGILCSANNKRDLGEYYNELGDEVLPKRINFVTSAYFTGYDLKESYHLISVSAVQNRIHSLSDKKLKQIAGRCRDILHSETIVYETGSMEKESVRTIETLVDAAEKEKLAITCLESNYASNSLLSSQLSRIRKLVLESTHDDEFRLVRRNIDKENVISYLNIDANLENQRVKMELYQSYVSLKDILEEQGHAVTFEQKNTTSSRILTDSSLESRVKSITELIKKLRDFNPVHDNLDHLKENLSGREKQVFDMYEEFYLHIDRNQLLDKIEEVAVGRDDRALKNLRVSAKIAVLPTTHTYLKRVMEHVVIGQKYTNEELVIAWNDIFQSLGFHRSYTDSEGVKSLKWTKVHFKNYKVKGLPQHKITGVNPSEFTIIQHDTGKISDVLKTLKVYFEQST